MKREEIPEHKLEELYNEALDEAYGVVQICGYEYDASRALKLVDPVAYRCGFNDWLDSETGELFVCLDDRYYYKDESEEENEG